MLSVALGSLCFTSRAQDNYYVGDGNLRCLTETIDNGFVGAKFDSTVWGYSILTRTDEDFNVVWSVGPFSRYIDDIATLSDSSFVVVSRNAGHIMISKVDWFGNLETSKKVNESLLRKSGVEVLSDGLLFSIVYDDAGSSGYGGSHVRLYKTDFDLNVLWVKEWDSMDNTDFGVAKIEVRSDSVMLMATMYKTEFAISTLSKLDKDGNLIWSRHVGTDCSYYQDFTQLASGEFVMVGDYAGEGEFMKVSVLNDTGKILATKHRALSSADWGGHNCKVVGLSDSRYVISNTYVKGPGVGSGAALFFFDNHGLIEFKGWDDATDAGIDDRDIQVWGVDRYDRILFTARTQSEETWSDVKYSMGKLAWVSGDCDLWNNVSPTAYYRIEPTETIEPIWKDTTVALEDTAAVAPPQVYYNYFKCSNPGFDPGPTETVDHLYGDTTWSIMCSTTYYGDGGSETEDTTGMYLSQLEKQLRIYPNPANGQFTLESSIRPDYLILRSLDGAEVLRFTGMEYVNRINTSGLRKGTYLLSIGFDEGVIHRKLVVL